MADSIKIWFMDGSYKSFPFSREDKMEDLWYNIVQKLGLSNQGAECFFLWASCDTLELLCYTDERVVQVMQDWPSIHSKYHSRPIGFLQEAAHLIRKMRHTDIPEMRLTFRTTAILPLSQERNIKDPMCIRLFYVQAVHNVLKSNYPCEPSVAAGLAGLQLQLTLGNHNPDVHTVGYLGKFMKAYIPQHLVFRMRGKKWKERIWEEHRRHTGKDQLILQLLYLQLVRQWPYYGSTFFKAEYIPVNTTFYRQPFEGEVRIGINMQGLHVIDPRRMIMNTYSYTELKEWESDRDLFFFLTPKGEVKKHIYRTPQAHLINDLLWDVINDLAGKIKKIDTIREKQGGKRIVRKNIMEHIKVREDPEPGSSLPNQLPSVGGSGVGSSDLTPNGLHEGNSAEGAENGIAGASESSTSDKEKDKSSSDSSSSEEDIGDKTESLKDSLPLVHPSLHSFGDGDGMDGLSPPPADDMMAVSSMAVRDLSPLPSPTSAINPIPQEMDMSFYDDFGENEPPPPPEMPAEGMDHSSSSFLYTNHFSGEAADPPPPPPPDLDADMYDNLERSHDEAHQQHHHHHQDPFFFPPPPSDGDNLQFTSTAMAGPATSNFPREDKDDDDNDEEEDLPPELPGDPYPYHPTTTATTYNDFPTLNDNFNDNNNNNYGYGHDDDGGDGYGYDHNHNGHSFSEENNFEYGHYNNGGDDHQNYDYNYNDDNNYNCANEDGGFAPPALPVGVHEDNYGFNYTTDDDDYDLRPPDLPQDTEFNYNYNY